MGWGRGLNYYPAKLETSRYLLCCVSFPFVHWDRTWLDYRVTLTTHASSKNWRCSTMAEVEVSSNGASELEAKKVQNEENTAQEEAPDTAKEEVPVQLNGESDHKETEQGQGSVTEC